MWGNLQTASSPPPTLPPLVLRILTFLFNRALLIPFKLYILCPNKFKMEIINSIAITMLHHYTYCFCRIHNNNNHNYGNGIWMAGYKSNRSSVKIESSFDELYKRGNCNQYNYFEPCSVHMHI